MRVSEAPAELVAGDDVESVSGLMRASPSWGSLDAASKQTVLCDRSAMRVCWSANVLKKWGQSTTILEVSRQIGGNS